MNNIISWTNAGKREYGENHWFWAVWIDVDAPETPQHVRSWRVNAWNETEPTESGFCSSEKAARRSAWAAIKRRVTVKSQRQAYRRWWWASQYLSHQRMNDDRPQFSRCKVSKDRWLWAVYRDGGWYGDEKPLARGIAKSAEAAYEAAVEAVGAVRQAGNWLANALREKEAAVSRSQRTTKRVDAAPMEFVYECHRYYSDYDFREYDSITKHRIVKRTKKRIYVDREPWREDVEHHGDWRDYLQSTFILDRQEFEKNGKATRSGRWYGTYYADPAIYHAERKATRFRPEHLAILNLPADASEDDVHSAFRRLALKTHPDKGGDAEAFKRVRQAYEEALALATAA